jgi:hypothetical protein
MKRSINTLFFAGIFFGISIGLASCNKDDNPTPINDDPNINLINLQAQVINLPTETLSTDEINSLEFLREEEKLARDVYITMYSKWGAKIFNNISNSEQTHMDAVLQLLNKYNITDPVGSNPVGVFQNTALQNLYNQLVDEGKISLLAAYKVGATIEDLDIFDLSTALTKIDNQDITLVYEMLTKGSRNHLRSFYKNILSIGGTYSPQYITQLEFDAIINGSMETGF